MTSFPRHIEYGKCVMTAMVVVFCIAVFNPQIARAEATRIHQQQEELKTLRKVWKRIDVPRGISGAGTVQALGERSSAVRNSALLARNVFFDFVDDIGFTIKDLAATLEPIKPGDPVIFDEVDSFVINIHRGEVLVTSKALSALFNKHILAYSPRPLNDMDVKTGENYLMARGGLKLWNWFPGIWLPATLGGKISITQENKLVYELDNVAALGIPLFGLLKTLGIKLTWLLSLERDGAVLKPFSLELDHRTVFPMPRISGNVASVRLSEEGLHLTFADNENLEFAEVPVTDDSYLWLQSGDPKLFGVVVTNARVAVVAEDKSRPLRFNLYDYRKQTARGVITMLMDGTVIATIPEPR